MARQVVMQCVDCGVLKRANKKPCVCGGKAFSQPTAREKYEFGQKEKKQRERSAKKLEAVKQRYAEDAKRKEREDHAKKLQAAKDWYAEEAERKERERLSWVRLEAQQKLRRAKEAAEVGHSNLQRRQFDRAWCWVFVHCLESGAAEVTQVGNKGFYWKCPGQVVPEFVAWGDVKDG